MDGISTYNESETEDVSDEKSHTSRSLHPEKARSTRRDKHMADEPSKAIRETWSARRAKLRRADKQLMARHCASHSFLVREGLNPETDPRETVASILVNQGTTPNIVVEEILYWVEKNQGRGPFDITWYTPGHLIPTTLRSFREQHPHLSLATQLFLFPGRVDQQTEAVSGPDAVDFAERLERRFTYSFLSANSLDLNDGVVYFHLPEEVRLQRACATRYAAHKFLFLDSSKFKCEGEIGYRIDDLLSQSETVTIYTVSSDKDQWLQAKFKKLCDRILNPGRGTYNDVDTNHVEEREMKKLRLLIVGANDRSTQTFEEKGFLIDSPTSAEQQLLI